MVGNLDGEGRGLRHLREYVEPLLKSDLEYTHTLALQYGDITPGTPIKVTGYEIVGERILLETNLGVIPQGKVNKPTELKKPNKSANAVGVQNQVSTNLGGVPTGTSKTKFDFQYPQGSKPIVFGKVSVNENPDVLVRGESKAERGKMGESALVHDRKTSKWNLSGEEMGKKFKQAKVGGVPLLKHLDKTYPSGDIPKGFSTAAPPGMANHYLNHLGVNVLHCHDLQHQTGTTYTVGTANEIKGHTKLAHLQKSDIDKLDGSLNIAATTTRGKSSVKHKPKRGGMIKLAGASKLDPINHRNLHDKAHANEFMRHIDIFKRVRDTKPEPSYKLNPHTPGSDIPFYGDDEKKRMVKEEYLEEAKDYHTLYHGTTDRNISDIMKRGIVPKGSAGNDADLQKQGEGGYVSDWDKEYPERTKSSFVTKTKNWAEIYAWRNQRANPETKPAVLRLRVPHNDPNLKPEEKGLKNSYRYHGTISPDMITHVRIGDPSRPFFPKKEFMKFDIMKKYSGI